MKLIDKFLKKLNTNRNNFATYILTLITIYIAVDRLVEILLIILTGVSYSYWGPIQYCLAMACPMLAYSLSVPSEYSTSKAQKVKIFYVYIILFGIIVISMFTQWLNKAVWILLLSVPEYEDLVTNFSELFRPALVSMSIFIPIALSYKIFNFLYFDINDSLDIQRSIWDYSGISLSDKSIGHGPFTFEVFFSNNIETGESAIIPEASRFQATLVCGGSGSGKTSMVFEPLIARDLERKFFFSEVSKEMGFTALKTNIAVLNKPYDNNYLNKHFKLSMLSPAFGKDTIYKTYMKKMILSDSPELIYKDCGVTVMSPDKEISENILRVSKNFGFTCNIIDPSDSNSMGINPFVYDDPYKIAVTISSILQSIHTGSTKEFRDAYKMDIIIQAIENISILLKEMYPKMNEGALPNLEDLFKMLSNFDLVEKMAEILATDEKLKAKYSDQLSYFKKNFYKNAPNREITRNYMNIAITELNHLLKLDSMKNILCNRYNNINFDKALANGEITLVCTRRGDLGSTTHRLFGLFFLITFSNSTLARPGIESSRIPHFLYIDEFSDFICKETEPIFTMFRKYKVGTTISTQNLSQLEGDSSENENFKQTILANCVNKIFTGNATIEDLQWWEIEFGDHREWKFKNTIDFSKVKYDDKHSDVEWKWTKNFLAGKLQSFGQFDCAYKIKNEKGYPLVGQGKLAHLNSKYKEPQKIKSYDFGRFSDGVTTNTEDLENGSIKSKFNPKKLDFLDSNNEFNPVQTDTTDSNYLFDNEDAIIVNFKHKNSDT